MRATNEEGTGDWSEPGEGRTIIPLTVQMTTELPPPVEGPFTVRFSFSEEVRGFTSGDIETQQEPACTDSANNPISCNPTIAALQTTDNRIFTTTVTPQTEGVNHNYTLTITVPENTVDIGRGQQTERGRDAGRPYSAAGGDGADLIAWSDDEPRQRPGDAEMEMPRRTRAVPRSSATNTAGRRAARSSAPG